MYENNRPSSQVNWRAKFSFVTRPTEMRLIRESIIILKNWLKILLRLIREGGLNSSIYGNVHWLRKWRKQARVCSVYARTLIPLDVVHKSLCDCQAVWFFKKFLKTNFLKKYLEEAFSCNCYYCLTDNNWWRLCQIMRVHDAACAGIKER